VTDGVARGDRLMGLLEAVAAASLWGTSGVFSVYLFRLGVPPGTVALVRPAIGVSALAALIALVRPKALVVDGRGLIVLGVGGGVAVGVFQLAYQLSTDAVGVPTTVALLYLAPVAVVAASGPLLGEWPNLRRVTLAGVTVVGVWLSVLGAEETSAAFGSSGLGWGLLASASYATYTLFGRYAAPRYGVACTVVYSTAGASVSLATAGIVAGPYPLPTTLEAWLLLAAFATITISAAQLLFFDALGRMEASRVSIASAAEPAVAAILATVLLSQGLRPLGWTGIGLIVAGVVGVGWPEER
jgi:DME family drug/metabolite transporter